MYIHKFKVQESVDEVVTLLHVGTISSPVPAVRLIVSPRLDDGGIAYMAFFRADAPTNDIPDDNGEDCWNYRRDGVFVQGCVVSVVVLPLLDGAKCAFVCHDDEYLPEFRRMLRLFGQELPDVNDDTPETERYKRLDRMIR